MFDASVALEPCPQFEPAPVRRARASVWLLALPLQALCLLGVLGLLRRKPVPEPPPPRRTVAVLLVAPSEPVYPDLVLPPGPSGGNSLGTGTRDQELATATVVPTALDPIPADLPRLGPPLPGDMPVPLAAKGLPVAPGGNGLPKGTGRGYGIGFGNGTGAGLRKPRILHFVRPFHRSKEICVGIVTVSVEVDAKGVPTKITPVEGHPDLLKAALSAIELWRFERPEDCGHRAPHRMMIHVDFLNM